jgi:light-harvesting protein B-800-850 alpha chain
MNNAKMWLVVKPTVGIPLFLTGVAVASLAVHVAVITAGVGSWYTPYVTGSGGAAPAAEEESAAMTAPEAIRPASAGAAATAFVEVDAAGRESLRVILPDGRTATLVVDDLTSAALLE